MGLIAAMTRRRIGADAKLSGVKMMPAVSGMPG
ncbi:MAG: hypothetical protein QOE70_4060 [Chthoniobacter sp.]|nr:hypothetical protein [Chthoniobacter sp.]